MFAAVLGAAVLAAALGCLILRWVLVGRATPAAETAVRSLDWMTATQLWPQPEAAPRPAVVDGWQTVTVEDLTVARDLLDLLEATGFAERELVLVGDSTFVVRWR